MTLRTSEEYHDPAYSTEPASDQILILELSENSTSILWYHVAKRMFTGYAFYPTRQSISELLNKGQNLSAGYKEVLISYQTHNYLLYPNLLGASIEEETFRLTNELSEGERLQHFQLVNLKAQVVYPLGEEMDADIHRSFNHFSLIPHIAPGIEREVNKLKGEEHDSAIWLHVYGDRMDLRVYKEGSLRLANSYFQSGKEDSAYYNLYAAEILKLDPQTTPLFYSGLEENKGTTVDLLSEYWKDLRSNAPLETLSFSHSFPLHIQERYAHLTQILLCAS